MGRNPFCNTKGLKRGAWTPEEDQKLVSYIRQHGQGSWRSLPHQAGLLRCGKSCRMRWTNYLRPDIKRGDFSPEEEKTIIQLRAVLGNKWSTIAKHLPRRTDNDIKNHWNTKLKRRASDQITATDFDHPDQSRIAATCSDRNKAAISKQASLLNKVAASTSRFLKTKSHFIEEVKEVVSKAKQQANSKPSNTDDATTSNPRRVSGSSLVLNRIATRLSRSDRRGNRVSIVGIGELAEPELGNEPRVAFYGGIGHDHDRDLVIGFTDESFEFTGIDRNDYNPYSLWDIDQRTGDLETAILRHDYI